MGKFGEYALYTLAILQDRSSNNPLLPKATHYSHPGGMKFNDTYYVVARTLNTAKGIFAIYTSSDLKKWKPGGFIFNKNNTPPWALMNSLDTPSIHHIGSNFIVYFMGEDASKASPYDQVGVAIASHPLGPYKAIEKPILTMHKAHSHFPTIMEDGGKLYMLWSRNREGILVRALKPSGDNFSSTDIFNLVKPSFSWEAGSVFAPWYLRRGNFHYIFYSGNYDCEGAVGIARSYNALGPYTKLPIPILKANIRYGCIEDVTVLKDVDEKTDIMIFKGEGKDHGESNVLLASILWGFDDWPYVGRY